MSSFLRAANVRKATAKRADDLRRLVDRERRLRDVRELLVGRTLEPLDVLDRLDENDRIGSLAHRADDLLVPRVADEHDGVALGCVTPGLNVHLGHERARRVDRVQLPLRGALVNGRSNAVRGKNDRRPDRRVGFRLDEDRPAILEVANNVSVVNDLMPNVNRRPVVLERQFNGLDSPFHAGTKPARRSK